MITTQCRSLVLIQCKHRFEDKGVGWGKESNMRYTTAEEDRAGRAQQGRVEQLLHLAHCLLSLSGDVSQFSEQRPHYWQELSEQDAAGTLRETGERDTVGDR
jgi:hypothetical protein